jgi:hypothetical protein
MIQSLIKEQQTKGAKGAGEELLQLQQERTLGTGEDTLRQHTLGFSFKHSLLLPPF